MRYLKRQVINRRDPADKRLAVDINNSVLMTTPTGVQVPAGTTNQRPIRGQKYGTQDATDLSGFLRYNVDTDQIEGYQSGRWRAIRYKEPIGIIQQYLGLANGNKKVFGPLVPSPPSTGDIDVNTAWSSGGNVTTPGNVWTGANMIVIVGNVFQVFNTNYVIQDGASITPTLADPGPFTAGMSYIVFTSLVPGTTTDVYVLRGFDR